MCFSATASFVAAGVTGAIGIAAMTRVSRPRELPLAVTPILFALQQAIEGLLWLHLPTAPAGAAAARLTFLFLLFAESFWPVYAPVAALLLEPPGLRRRLMVPCLAAGIGVVAYLSWWMLAGAHHARILGGHIVYDTGFEPSAAVGAAYLAATCLPLMLSSQRTVAVLGAIILAGCAVAYAFYWDTLVSVWCFFAAAASLVILGHFERARRRRLRVAVG